ncbi:valine--tRNA ligase [bacterium CG2_30_40_12]|nr:MAG: valine--tRNA ligase [bacterium CG2_30_40_12]
MEMEKTYNHKNTEEAIYKMWEKGGFFTPKIEKSKKPFTILLPLPNANDPMHIGHALFTIQDILIRYHRMLGEPTLWLPGGDHAGIETQYVFEKHLAKEGKSRFNYDSETLYKMISSFVEENKDINKSQMKQLGFSLDWTRYRYSLEPTILETVFDTFRELYKDNLIYRNEKMVNFCPKCGTAFSDLEINHQEKEDILYYLDYGAIKIATARPETIFADAAVAVNPDDKRYKNIQNKKAVIPIINKEIPIITDKDIKVDFGTGALKVTPAHDPVDYEIGQGHNLEVIKTIDRNGRMINVPQRYLGLKILRAREAVVADLEKEGKLVKTEPLKHAVSLCYKCGSPIEPFLIPQWFVKTKALAKPAIQAVKEGKTKIVPKKRFEKMYFDWLENVLDWNISRQIVWGPRIPAWFCLDCNQNIEINFIDKNGQKVWGEYKNLKEKYNFSEIEKGLQSLSAPVDAEYSLESDGCPKCRGKNVLQETDTFDTWFLSGQWPLTTLGYPNGRDFKYFYPTSVLDTMWDILFFWVARMMMLGLYRTGKVPFKTVHIHARVVDKQGKKMSKSKGNVIGPIEMAEKYGADALRMSLVFGVAPASDVVVSEDKIRAMRNFANKVWNASRFVLQRETKVKSQESRVKIEGKRSKVNEGDKWIIQEMGKTAVTVTRNLEKYRFDKAVEEIYHFFWHSFCDKYIESVKDRREDAQTVLEEVLETSLKLLHPFMPFVTEEIWGKLPKKKDTPLIISSWPSA